MRILKEGIETQITCDRCHSVLEYNFMDLEWSHTEEGYYYVTCPVCGERIWIKANDTLDRMYNRKKITLNLSIEESK